MDCQIWTALQCDGTIHLGFAIVWSFADATLVFGICLASSGAAPSTRECSGPTASHPRTIRLVAHNLCVLHHAGVDPTVTKLLELGMADPSKITSLFVTAAVFMLAVGVATADTPSAAPTLGALWPVFQLERGT